MTSAVATLSTRLLPWLRPVFAQLDTARRAGNLGHAWLISGPAGTGKVNLALVLANLLFGGAAEPDELSAKDALGALAARHDPQDGHPDLHWLHPEEDKQTISVDQVRDVIEAFNLTAHGGGAKVILIEPAEALTTAAANALLKTLEEPSPGGYLLLVSHQPGRLASTIRSRCQYLTLRAPGATEVAAWLGVPAPAVLAAQRSVGTGPLDLAAAFLNDNLSLFKKLESDLHDLSQDRLDPQAVAQTWAKGDSAVALAWLRRRLHEAVRARCAAPPGSTDVTVPAGATLHNAWAALPLRTLLDVYDRAEKLANQLGSGVNMELALSAMLNELIVNRGRS
jgi:DNA polymerase-3 subunit delta'